MKTNTTLIALCFLLFASVYVVAAELIDNGDNTVTDNNTGLIWQKGEGGEKIWDDAISYCEGLSLAGYNDWRLPNIKELESIVDDTLYNPAIGTNFFPNAQESRYWSSTNFSNVAKWVIMFDHGGVNHYGMLSSGVYVRCVRGGQ